MEQYTSSVLSNVKRDNSCISDFSQHQTCTDDGVTYAAGEQWMRNNCTKCYCIDGKTMCMDQPCPDISCKFMRNVPGRCCPVCVGKACQRENYHFRDKVTLRSPSNVQPLSYNSDGF